MSLKTRNHKTLTKQSSGLGLNVGTFQTKSLLSEIAYIDKSNLRTKYYALQMGNTCEFRLQENMEKKTPGYHD